MNTSDPRQFPHDRVVFFSDAVFGIAITLLVIEIKVPSHDSIHELGVVAALKKLIPLFIGYVVSFIVCGLFWKSHLQIFQFIKRINARVIWLNILLLLFVALMPFSTALYSENFGSNAAFTFYCLNLAAIGIVNWGMYVYAHRQGYLSEISNARWLKNRPLIAPVIFLLCIPLAYLSPLISRFGFVLIFVFQVIGERIFAKGDK